MLADKIRTYIDRLVTCNGKMDDTKWELYWAGHDDAIKKVKEGLKKILESEYTPDNITHLEPNEVFVFGSNLAGRHGKGAAKYALDHFGAEYGVGEGLQGQSYAFPTLDGNLNKLDINGLQISVGRFHLKALENPDKIFYLTKVGCGLAGFEEEYMKSFFKVKLSNVIYPEGW